MDSQSLKRQLEIILHSTSELLDSIHNNKIKSEDLETIWLSLFQQAELYNSEQIIKMYKVLYESAIISLLQMKREDFMNGQNEMAPKRELSYEDAAIYLDCSVSTIKRLVGSNKLLPKRYNSKNVRITMAELERFKGSVVQGAPNELLSESKPKSHSY